MTEYLYWLDNIQPQHRSSVGELAYMLGIALQDGYPVLPGFVITAPLFIQFLETVDWPDPLFADFPHSSFHLDIYNPIQLRSIAQCLQTGIMTQSLADKDRELIWRAVQALKVSQVQIQPSIGFRDFQHLKTKHPAHTAQSLSTLLTHAQPLLSTLICCADRDSLIHTIHQMWSQFLGANHLFYWQRLGITLQHLQVGLLIRPVTSAMISGKTRLNLDGACIDALWGSASALVDGDVTPDQYRYQNGALMDQQSAVKRYVYILPCSASTSNPLTSREVEQVEPLPDPSLGSPETEICLSSVDLRSERYLIPPPLAVQPVLSEESGLGLLKMMQGLGERVNQILGPSEELLIEWSLYPRWAASAHWGCLQYEMLLDGFRGSSELSSDALLLDEQNVVYITQILSNSESQGVVLPVTPQENTVSAVDIAINHYQRHQGQQRLPSERDAESLDRQYSDTIGSGPSFLNSSSLDTTDTPILEEKIQGAFSDNSSVDLDAINLGETLRGLGTSAGQVLGQIWVMSDSLPRSSGMMHSIPKGYILLTQDLSPVWLNVMQSMKGILSSQGSMTCHAAIVARELGIPSVMGLSEVLSCLKTGDWVWLDGDRGTVTLIPEASVSALNQVLMQQRQSDIAQVSAIVSPTPLSEVDSDTELDDWQTDEVSDVQSPLYASANVGPKRVQTATQLMVSISLNQSDKLASIAAQASDGIGLIRSEIMLAALLQHQSITDWLKAAHRDLLVKTMQHHIKQFAQAFAPRPIWYRTLDMHRYHWTASHAASRREMNPLLGCHGAMSYRQSPGFFMAELEAIRKLQLEGLRNINLIMPFVRTIEEFQFCHRMIEQAQILVDGDCEVWIMAEVPSILFLLPDYVAAGVQGIAIGTNDLTQLLLATDRMNPAMNMSGDASHPAVLRAIEHLISQAKQAQIPCSLCGELVSQYPTIVESLIRWGVTTLSVSPDALVRTHHEILRAEKRLFLEWGRD